jgi:hypothetical protein
MGRKGITSGAKALIIIGCNGTTEVVPFQLETKANA